MRETLYRRGCDVDRVCPMCGDSNETVIHALLICQEVMNIWKLSPLRLEVIDNGASSFKEWIIGFSLIFKNEVWWDIFWSLLWGIWLRRNAWVFEGRRLESMDVIRKTMSFVEEYAKANDDPTLLALNEQAGSKVWHAPEEGMYKINSDAALFESRKVGLGGVMRDYVGDIMAATCMVVDGSMEIDVAEALAARHALKIAIESGLSCIILESDNLKLINHLKRSTHENTSFGNIVSDILWLGNSCNSISFNHVRREGNKVAHTLAHVSREFSSMRVWLEEVPSAALSFVMDDLLHMNA